MEIIVDFLAQFLTIIIILFIVLGTVSVYRENSRKAEIEVEHKVEVQKMRHRILILIVDDRGQDLTNIYNLLREKEEYHFIIAASVKEAQSLLTREQPKYALIDLNLSGTEKDEFDGIQLFKFIFQQRLLTKPIVISAYSFEHTKSYFGKCLKDTIGDKLESALQDIQDNYIDKLGSYNYLRAIADKLEVLERAEKSGK